MSTIIFSNSQLYSLFPEVKEAECSESDVRLHARTHSFGHAGSIDSAHVTANHVAALFRYLANISAHITSNASLPSRPSSCTAKPVQRKRQTTLSLPLTNMNLYLALALALALAVSGKCMCVCV